MYALQQYLTGLLIIHLALIIAYAVGSALLANGGRRSPWQNEPALDVVICIGTGFAAIGFVTFFFGIVGLLTPLGFVGVLAVVLAVAAVLSPSCRQRGYWRERVAVLRALLARPGAWLLWVVLCALAYPAAQPPTAFDATFYHQVYAIEWAQHHQIFVDPFRRFPYYASNFVLIFAWFEVLHLGAYTQFVSWATGALSAVLAYGLVLQRLPARSLVSDLAAASAGLPFLVAPMFLRWWDTGMNDAAIGFFFFLAVVVTVENAVAPDRRTTIASVAIAGFFLGMKPTLPFFFPLFALLAVAAVRAGGGRWRHAVGVVAILAVIAAPWYVKNFIEDGDPAPPILHLALHRDDAYFSLVDAANISADMNTDRSPRALARLPLRMFESPDTLEFREPGTTLLAVFLGVPFVVLGIGLVRPRRSVLVLWAAALVSAYAYWILTAHYARYALLFYPLLAVFCIRLVITANERLKASPRWSGALPSAAAVAVLSAIILAEPTPSSAEWYNIWYQTNFVYGAQFFPSTDFFLRRSMQGYIEEDTVIAWLDAHPALPRRVYSFRLEQLAYSFATHGVQSIGDWVGPERYTDLKAAVDAGTLPQYLRHFDVSAVLLPQQTEFFKGADLDRFEKALLGAGFRRLPSSDNVDAFVRNK